MLYMAASKVDKPKVARDVVMKWKQLSPPGRFLARREGKGSTKGCLWYEVDDKKAREKTSQCLREISSCVPPVIEYVYALNAPTIETTPLELSSTFHPQGTSLLLGFSPNSNGIDSHLRRHSLPSDGRLPSHIVSPSTRRNSLPTTMFYGLKNTDICSLSDEEYQQQVWMMQQRLMEERQRLQSLQHFMLQAHQQRAQMHDDVIIVTPPSSSASDRLAAASNSPLLFHPKRCHQDDDGPEGNGSSSKPQDDMHAASYLNNSMPTHHEKKQRVWNDHLEQLHCCDCNHQTSDQFQYAWAEKQDPEQMPNDHGTDSSTASYSFQKSAPTFPIHVQQGQVQGSDQHADKLFHMEPDLNTGMSSSEPPHPLKSTPDVSYDNNDDALNEMIIPAQLKSMHDEENAHRVLKYRQQLEAFLRDTKEMALDIDFELQDDWEKELEVAVEKEQQQAQHPLESSKVCHTKSSLLDLSDVLSVQSPSIQMFKSQSACSILSLSSGLTLLSNDPKQREIDP
jgi:hypothetical protein